MTRTAAFGLLALILFSLNLPGHGPGLASSEYSSAAVIGAGLRPEPIAAFADTPASFDLKYFAPKNSNVKAIETIPLTADEFLKVYPPDLIIKGADGQVQVRFRKHYKDNGKDAYHIATAPLESYVAELNKYEKFLNQYGATLRDGKLNKQDPNDTQIQSDLGVMFRLRSRDEVEKSFKPKVDQLLYDPDKLKRFIPHDPRRDRTTRVNPGDSGIDLSRLNTNRSKLWSTTDLRLAENYLSFPQLGSRILKFNSEDPTQCEKTNTGGGPFLVPVCGAGDCKTGKTSTPADSHQDTQSEFCDEWGKKPEDPTCMYQGEITPKTIVALSSTFDAAGGGKGWFGAYASMDLISRVQQQDDYIGLTNSVMARAGVQILGSKIPLIEASKYVNWETGMSQPQLQPKPSATVLPTLLNLPFDTSYSHTIDGPSTVFFVGPVPITISSKFSVNVGLKNGAEPFLAPPPACGNPTNGRMSVFLGPEASADVTLTAAVDAVVASAGIEGQLTLSRDKFGANLTTEVVPDQNKLTITPTLTYSYTRLAGKILLFVEVDLGVYTKKWSVEIIDFGGFSSDLKTVSPKTFVLSSKAKKT